MTCAWASRRRVVGALLGVISGAACAGASVSPERSLRMTVAYPPGGVSDEVARELARRLESQLGTTVIVEHRPGAGGTLAMEALSRARADGMELCFSAITPLLRLPQQGPIRFDPAHDIAPVAAVMSTPVLVLATRAFKGKTFADLIAVARAAPGRIRWATSGHATTGHLVLEQIRASAAVAITHVPYSGGGQQLVDALAGQFEVLSSNVAARQLAYVRDGRLRALAVGAPQRLPVLREVPTFAELGYVGANLSSLFGVFAPGRTPAARLDQLNLQINVVLRQAEFRQQLLANANLPVEGSREDFIRLIELEALALRRLLGGGVRTGK